jgi:hypothetical protein
VDVDATEEAKRRESRGENQTEKPKGQHGNHVKNETSEKNVKNADLDKI